MKKPQKRASLTAEQIIEVALRFSDSEGGLEQLTLRRIASELNVGTMTLYSYFRSKEEILDGMADYVLGQMQLPQGGGSDPKGALRTVGYAFLSLMRDHPSVLQLFGSRITDSQTALRGAMESVLQYLVSSGIPGPLAVRCYGFLITYAIGFASYQVPRPWGHVRGEAGAEQRRQRRHFYAALPIKEFPQVVSLASELVALPSDEQFEAGLEAYIKATVDMIDTERATER